MKIWLTQKQTNPIPQPITGPRPDRRRGRLGVLLLTIVALLALMGPVKARPAYAAGITVNSTADTVADDGACTLREAITNANNDDQSGSVDCAAGSGADTITFSVDGTIALGATLPEINSEMTIAGDGVTLDGQDSVRVFRIGSLGQATMTNITITRGRISEFGGGIFNDGQLTLTNALLINNFGGPGGGALHNSSSAVATVRNTTFEANTGETGGAIHNNGDITITYSTFNGNIEPGPGAGASVANFKKMQIGASIFANSVNDTHCFDFGRPSSLGYNLSDDDSCPFFSTGDLNEVDALLGPLTNNGGDTETHALLAGSQAINHIPNGTNDCGTTITTDQRGVARPQESGCDIGAFEAESPADTTPPVITPNVSGALGNNGWYISDVTVSWTVSDDESAIISTNGCETTLIDSDTAGTTLTCEATSDGGANSASVTIQRDATAPVVSVTGVEDGASYTLGAVPTAGCDTQDALSGVATQASLTTTGGDGNGLGSFTATCEGATDNAGNSAGPISVSYTVTETSDTYEFKGFLPLISNPPAVNKRLAGQIILFRFSLNGDQGLDILAEGYPVSQEINCNSQAPTGDIEAAEAADSGLSYNRFTDRYHYLWKTGRDWKRTCRQFILRLDDGSDHIALFQFK